MALTLRTPLFLAALALPLVLGACGTGGGLGKALLLTARAAKAPAIAIDDIPRAEIEALGVPTMRVTVPARGIDLLMFERDRRGNVVTYAASDGSTFTFRDGVLIETRGIGADLMSAAAPSIGGLTGGSHARSWFFMGPDDQILRHDATCQPSDGGARSLTIQGKAHATRRVDETCSGVNGRITNSYWLQGGVVRASRQWVSASAGYAEFQRITD